MCTRGGPSMTPQKIFRLQNSCESGGAISRPPVAWKQTGGWLPAVGFTLENWCLINSSRGTFYKHAAMVLPVTGKSWSSFKTCVLWHWTLTTLSEWQSCLRRHQAFCFRICHSNKTLSDVSFWLYSKMKANGEIKTIDSISTLMIIKYVSSRNTEHELNWYM